MDRVISYHSATLGDRWIGVVFRLGRAGVRLSFQIFSRLFASGLFLGAILALPGPAMAQAIPEPVAVVRGLPPPATAEAVGLCPDIGERPEIFTARDGSGLAGRLSRAGYRVYLVDPWNTTQARSEGFDGVVQDVFPELLRSLAQRSGTGSVVWIGHGLCGVLPTAAAARPGQGLPISRWVALGTRFDLELPSPLLLQWLASWSRDEVPLPGLVNRLLLTGLRERMGPRASSVPPSIPDDGGAEASLGRWFGEHLAQQPPREVVEDLQRWLRTGRMADRAGWVDYQAGLASVAGPSLLVSGITDPVAPPESVLAGLDALGPGAKPTYHLLSRVQGDREEYGHLGMLLSRHSARDVDSMIVAWLRGRKVLP